MSALHTGLLVGGLCTAVVLDAMVGLLAWTHWRRPVPRVGAPIQLTIAVHHWLEAERRLQRARTGAYPIIPSPGGEETT